MPPLYSRRKRQCERERAEAEAGGQKLLDANYSYQFG
jgi:hypothetical protein